MRLDIEKAKKYLRGMHRLWLCDEWEQPYDSKRCRDCESDDDCLDIVLSSGSMSDIAQDLLDTIEALQQENEQLKAENKQLQVKLENWKYKTQCYKDDVILRDNDIERLRNSLTRAYVEIEKYKCLWNSSKPSGCDCSKPTELQDEIEQTLGGR